MDVTLPAWSTDTNQQVQKGLTPMDTYTIAAAWLVGAPKGMLYEAIRTSRL
jgi:hypothetical protein